ncbi:hypothetical protein GCM10018781_65380 [Kitasatospora indigofera]|uniref:Uncharacterized protein n=1 Tax=Kitasatospora indigofera TaxID=67307 RepID=A0A919GD83_9ACTN|nr:hypothetical protein [Kitasatospora indigofera]GHH81870.1 hypothetical protein GCM10018781_65380 [Kitasatospora indigofera]
MATNESTTPEPQATPEQQAATTQPATEYVPPAVEVEPGLDDLFGGEPVAEPVPAEGDKSGEVFEPLGAITSRP